jgi:hypothetical protein
MLTYATSSDFCRFLSTDLHPLYLLAFVLTGNHAAAERCFLATLEDSLRADRVFKGWEGTWSKRTLIINAIHLVFSERVESGGKPEFWSAVDFESPSSSTANALTRLAPPLLRFVFVMSVLERFSEHECALLLGRTFREVAAARVDALRQLPALQSAFGKSDERTGT